MPGRDLVPYIKSPKYSKNLSVTNGTIRYKGVHLYSGLIQYGQKKPTTFVTCCPTDPNFWCQH